MTDCGYAAARRAANATGSAGSLARPASPAKPAAQGRHIQRRKPVMPQPAQVAVEERPEIGDAVFQHRQPVDPQAKGKALPLVGIASAGPWVGADPCPLRDLCWQASEKDTANRDSGKAPARRDGLALARARFACYSVRISAVGARGKHPVTHLTRPKTLGFYVLSSRSIGYSSFSSVSIAAICFLPNGSSSV